MGDPSKATALVIGVGALGGPAALSLAAGGAGRLLLLDALPVGPLDAGAPPFRDEDLGLPRAAAAARHLARRFPGVATEVGHAGGLAALVASADVVVDASNHFPTMFLANDAAVAAGRPLVHAGVLRLSVQLLTVLPGEGGCLRCLFEGPPETAPAADGDVPGPLAGFAGALLGSEALRVLAGRPAAYAGRLLVHDARSGRARAVPVRRRATCAACDGMGPTALAAAAGGAP